jgi:hypothetical protein
LFVDAGLFDDAGFSVFRLWSSISVVLVVVVVFVVVAVGDGFGSW